MLSLEYEVTGFEKLRNRLSKTNFLLASFCIAFASEGEEINFYVVFTTITSTKKLIPFVDFFSLLTQAMARKLDVCQHFSLVWGDRAVILH